MMNARPNLSIARLLFPASLLSGIEEAVMECSPMALLSVMTPLPSISRSLLLIRNLLLIILLAVSLQNKQSSRADLLNSFNTFCLLHGLFFHLVSGLCLFSLSFWSLLSTFFGTLCNTLNFYFRAITISDFCRFLIANVSRQCFVKPHA